MKKVKIKHISCFTHIPIFKKLSVLLLYKKIIPTEIGMSLHIKRGFTLVEALVAISILMIAIASPMTLAQKGLSTATLSKDQMTASFLAQDAIETIKNLRDQTAIRGSVTNNWLDSLSFCVCNPNSPVNENCDFDNLNNLKYCRIDSTADFDNMISPGNEVNSPILRISNDLENKFLKFDYLESSQISKYSRYINIIKSVSNPDEAVARVRVSWSNSQGEQKIDVQNFIYNYSENI